jgi:hypothetical protein
MAAKAEREKLAGSRKTKSDAVRVAALKKLSEEENRILGLK